VRMLQLVLLALCCCLAVKGYTIDSNFSGNNFFNGFDFFTGGDPTHGYVTYASQAQADQWGLIKINNGKVEIYSDHTTVASGSGRRSVRLTSKKAWNSGLFLLDLEHMPTGCGTWPAWWTVGPNWPAGGEIDIIEGVNVQNFDQSTLHTDAGCTNVANKNDFSGTSVGTNCLGNSGCGITTSAGTYGAPFNSHQGGVFAMEWTSTYIRMFYFARGSIPADITKENPNPGSWGKPYALFDLGGSCPASHFKNHQMVFDLTFCGDWAGAVFASQCPGKGSCNSYVQNNPSAFAEAYWVINYATVYRA